MTEHQSPVLSREELSVETIAMAIYRAMDDELTWETEGEHVREWFRKGGVAVLDLLHRQDTTEGLREALKAAQDERDDALSTLGAWFDRKPLLSTQIDPAVKEAVSGYLRTCRSGGMPRKQSDAVEAAIDGMCQLGIFADLFGRVLGEPTPGASSGEGTGAPASGTGSREPNPSVSASGFDPSREDRKSRVWPYDPDPLPGIHYDVQWVKDFRDANGGTLLAGMVAHEKRRSALGIEAPKAAEPAGVRPSGESPASRSEATPSPTDPKAESGEGAGVKVAATVSEAEIEAAYARLSSRGFSVTRIAVEYALAEAARARGTLAGAATGKAEGDRANAWPIIGELEKLEADLRAVGEDLTDDQGDAFSYLEIARGRISAVATLAEELALRTAPASTVPPSAGDAGLAEEFEELATIAQEEVNARDRDDLRDVGPRVHYSARAEAYREAASIVLARSSSTGAP